MADRKFTLARIGHAVQELLDAGLDLIGDFIATLPRGPAMETDLHESVPRASTRDRLRDVEPNDIQRQQARKLLNTEEKSKK